MGIVIAITIVVLMFFIIPIGLGYIALPFGRGLFGSKKGDYLEWWGMGLIIEALIALIIIALVFLFSVIYQFIQSF